MTLLSCPLCRKGIDLIRRNVKKAVENGMNTYCSKVRNLIMISVKVSVPLKLYSASSFQNLVVPEMQQETFIAIAMTTEITKPPIVDCIAVTPPIHKQPQDELPVISTVNNFPCRILTESLIGLRCVRYFIWLDAQSLQRASNYWRPHVMKTSRHWKTSHCPNRLTQGGRKNAPI